MMKSCKTSLFAISLLAASTSSVQAVCVNTVGACGPGCWNQDDLVVSGDLRVCVPVGVGRYSPNGSNDSFSCAVGSYSGITEAASCTLCEPGSFGGRTGLSACGLCPSGFYQDLEGQAFCKSCTQGYNGLGANAVLDPDICHLAGPSAAPSAAPTAPPSSFPSASPSLTPSLAPTASPSSAPSSTPSLAPSSLPSATPTASPSVGPSVQPSAGPSSIPTSVPSETPTGAPSSTPSITGSFAPSLRPSLQPSNVPSSFPSLEPSVPPSVEPSALPSLAPSMSPSTSPSLAPSSVPSASPSAAPSTVTVVNGALRDNGNQVCLAGDEFALHGQCAECPSLLRTIALAALFILVVLSLIAFFIVTAPCCSAVLFIGVEFFQVLSLVGITHVLWPRVLEIIFAFAALFGLDFDIISPMQCHLGFSPQGSHAVLLMLPVILSTIAICCIYLSFALGRSKKNDFRRNLKTVLRVVCLGLFFGYMKLVLTSLEAVTCSSVQLLGEDGLEDREIDWFCFGNGDAKDKVIALLGLLGVMIYGLGLPAFLGFLSYRYHDQVEESAGRIEHPTVLGEMTHLFLLPYRVDRWWWSAFVLARKFAYVNMVVFFQDAPSLSLAFIAVVSLLSGAAQWKQSPYFQDVSTNHVDVFTASFIFRNQTVDLALHGSIMLVVVLGVMFDVLPGDLDARVGLGILGLLVIIPSIVYLLGAGFYHSRQRLWGEKDSIDQTDLAASIDVEGGDYEAEIPDSTSSFFTSDSESCAHDDTSQMGSLNETDSDVAPASLLHVETVGGAEEWEEVQKGESASNVDETKPESEPEAKGDSNEAVPRSWGFQRMTSFSHA